MKSLGIICIIFGGIGIIASCCMYGDIAIAGMIGSVIGILTGSALVSGSKRISVLEKYRKD